MGLYGRPLYETQSMSLAPLPSHFARSREVCGGLHSRRTKSEGGQYEAVLAANQVRLWLNSFAKMPVFWLVAEKWVRLSEGMIGTKPLWDCLGVGLGL